MKTTAHKSALKKATRFATAGKTSNSLLRIPNKQPATLLPMAIQSK